MKLPKKCASFRWGKLLKSHGVCMNTLLSVFVLLLFALFLSVLVYLDPYCSNLIYLCCVLCVITISVCTDGYLYGVLSCFLFVPGANYLFIYPQNQWSVSPVFELIFTLLILSLSLFAGILCSRIKLLSQKNHEKDSLLLEAELEKTCANLLRAVSHDLRTPLTGIIGNSSCLLNSYRTMPAPEQLQLLHAINTDASWLLHMVENLLTITRIRGENFNITTAPESVEEVVSEALSRLSSRYPDALVHASVPEKVLFVPMDAMLIEQVIINLIQNAIVHSGSPLPIELTVTECGSQILFTVRDFGKGIPDTFLPHLFDGGFCTTNQIADRYKGMGIGLSICKTIVTAHQGDIFAENMTPGSKFCFSLPKGDFEIESTT